jgi:hypothetical protein
VKGDFETMTMPGTVKVLATYKQVTAPSFVPLPARPPSCLTLVMKLPGMSHVILKHATVDFRRVTH